MKILGYGGINTDFVYHVDRFVSEGESMPCKSLESILGGKGCNQSIAVALAGQKEVYHAGEKARDLVSQLLIFEVLHLLVER